MHLADANEQITQLQLSQL